MDVVAPLPDSADLPDLERTAGGAKGEAGDKTQRRWSSVGIPGCDLQADCYIQEKTALEQPREGFGIKAGTLQLVDAPRRRWINQVTLPLQPPPPEEAPILHEFSRPWRAFRLPLPDGGDCDLPLEDSLMKNYETRFSPGEPTFPSEVHVPSFLEPRVAVEDSRAFLIKPRIRFTLGTVEPLLCRLLVYDVHLACRVTEEFCFRIPGPDLGSKGAAGSVEAHLPAALVYILPNHLPQNLHLVLKVTKVLIGDGDSATAPYCTPDKFTSASEQRKLIDKAVEGAKRLGRYQQPLAWGTLPLAKGTKRAMPLYRQRTAVNEEQRLSLIAEAIRGSLKEKTVPAQCEFDLEEVDADKLSDVKFEQAKESGQNGPSPTPAALTLSIFDPFSESSSCATGTSGTATKNTQPSPTSINCREVQPFCHPSVTPNFGLTGSGPVAVSYVNTLYLYPLQIEKSQYRNVAIRVQLLQDTIDIVSGAEDSDTDAAVLRAIYGANHHIGKSAYALVTYHQKNPQFEDEIKICLPECLTPAHHILFTFYHVHCKKLQPNQQQEELIGYAALPLLGKMGTILQDNKYVMDVFPAPPAPKTSAKGGTIPLPTGYVAAARDGCFDTGKTVFSCRSRVVSSVHSQDSAVAEFLRPFYSNMRVSDSMDVDTAEEDTVNRLLGLAQSDTVTVRYFFFVIAKFVMGYVRFGSSLVRWAAFRTLLAVMEKAGWKPQRPVQTNDTNQVIHEFVRVVFDEAAIENFSGSDTAVSERTERDRTCSQSVFASILEEWFNVLHNKSPVEENADTKRMSLAYSSVLLQLILKSMAMHLLRQGGAAGNRTASELPMLLELNDEGLLGQVLVQLIECAGDTSNGLLVQKEVNRSVACFCCGLFLVANNAVPARVITGYMNWIDKAQGDANTLVHLWFPFLHTFIDFEFFATVNGAEATKDGPSYTHARAWLAKVIFEKLLCIADTQKEVKIQSEAMRLLRRMFTTQVYNPRYQTLEQQEMIALLYFPLFPTVAPFTASGKLLADPRFDDSVFQSKPLGDHDAKAKHELQKEVLICVGHLLSSVSNPHLPLFFRVLAAGSEHDAGQRSSRNPGWQLSPTGALSYYHRVIQKAEQQQARAPMQLRINDDNSETSSSWRDSEYDDTVDNGDGLPYNEMRVHACLAMVRLMIDVFLVKETQTPGGIPLWQQLLSPDLVTCDARISLLDIEQRLVHRRSHRRTGPDATASFNNKPSVGSNTSGDHSMIAQANGSGGNHKSLPRNWGKHYASAQQRRGSNNAGADDKPLPRSSLGSAVSSHKGDVDSLGVHDEHTMNLRQTVAYTVLRTLRTAVDQYEDMIRLIEVPLTPRLGQVHHKGKTRREKSRSTGPCNQAYALLGSLTELLFLLLRRTSCIEGLRGDSEHSLTCGDAMESSTHDDAGDDSEDGDSCFVVELLQYLETLLSRFPAALFAARIPELPLIYDQTRVQLLISIASTAKTRRVRQYAARLLGQVAAACYHQTGSFLLVKAPIVKVLTSVFFPLADRPNPSPSMSPVSLRDMLDEMKTLVSASSTGGTVALCPPSLADSFRIQFVDLLNGLTATVHAYERWRSGFTNPDGKDDFEEIEEGLDRVVKAISPHWLLEEKLIWLDALLCLHARRERSAEAACCKLDAIRFVQRVRLMDSSGRAEDTDELQQWVTRELVAARNYAERAGWVEQELAISEELLGYLKQQRRYAEYQETLQYLQVAAGRLAASQEGSSQFNGSAFSFYRVRYTGDCVSARIARSEYIYKRSKFTSLGEFVGELKAMLRAKYPHCERVDVVPEPKPLVGSEDQLNIIFLRVTTVEEASPEELRICKTGAVDAKDWQVAFRFALPFTLDGASSYGKTAEQMKRITYLSVARSFPCCLNRQLVLLRHEELRCPIENSMDDIRKRCVLLRAELDKHKVGQSDLKTLTLVLKGSVDTHVHGGVPEVLDSFLAAKPARLLDVYGRVMNSDDSQRKRHELANLLVTFAQLCWQCLLLSREAFRRSSQSDNALVSPPASTAPLPPLPHATAMAGDVTSTTRSFLPPSKPLDDSTASIFDESMEVESCYSPVTEVSPLQTEFERSFAALVGQIRSKIPFAYHKASELVALHRHMQRSGVGITTSSLSMSSLSVSPLPTPTTSMSPPAPVFARSTSNTPQ